MIRCTVDGNVGSDPELRKTASGKAVANFALASAEKVGDTKVTTWVEVVCWDDMAATAVEHVRKGGRVLVTGRLSVEEWTRNDGTKGSKIKLVAEDFGISLRWRPKASAAGSGEASKPAAVPDEDVPF